MIGGELKAEGAPAATYEALFVQVRNATGVALDIVNTGGGCHVARGRIETGQWIVVSEAEDFLSVDASQRFADEAARQTQCGWYVGAFANSTGEGIDLPDSDAGHLASLTAPDAHFGDLPALIVQVLQAAPAAHRAAL